MMFLKKINRNISILLLIACAMQQACDEAAPDVIPTSEEVDAAMDTDVPLTNGPVIVNLIQSTNLLGDATIAISKVPEKGIIEILESALLKYTPNEQFTDGVDSATYTICVGDNCDAGTLTFRYEIDTDGCVIKTENDFVSVPLPSQQVVIEILDNDEPCQGAFDVPTLTIVSLSGGEAVATDGLIFYYPVDGLEGSAELIYSIATQNEPEVLHYGVVSIDLLPEEVAELATNDDTFEYTYEEYQDELLQYNSLGIDLADILANDSLEQQPLGALEISLADQSTSGTTTYNSGEFFAYRPGETFTGSDSFTYQVCIDGRCSKATVTILVTDFPEEEERTISAVDDQFELSVTDLENYGEAERFLFSIDEILGNDEMGQLAYNQLESVSITTQPSSGIALYYSLESFSFQLGEDFQGTDRFVYQICGNGECSEATVSITVTDWQ